MVNYCQSCKNSYDSHGHSMCALPKQAADLCKKTGGSNFAQREEVLILSEYPEFKRNEIIENKFSYHAPKEGQPAVYKAIRDKAKNIAYYINEIAPDSTEKSLAITKLEEAVMWANAAISRH